MPPVNGSLWKYVAPFIALLVAGLVGFGALRNEAEGLRRDVEKKADREVVDVQFRAIMDAIQQLRLEIRGQR